MMRLVLYILVLGSYFVSSQTNRSMVREGNDLFDSGKYDEAITAYEQSMDIEEIDPDVQYNIANAYYRKDSLQKAIKLLKDLKEGKIDDDLRFKSLHNLGNAYFKSQQLQEAKKAYQSALRLNPSDMETRKNLMKVNELLKQQQQQDNQNQEQNKDNKENEDKENQDQSDNKDQQNQKDKSQEQQDKESNDQKDQNQQDQESQGDKESKEKDSKQGKEDNKNEGDQDQSKQEQGKQGEEGEPKKGQIGQMDAEQMLKDVEQNEDELRKALLLQKMKGVKRKNIEKQW